MFSPAWQCLSEEQPYNMHDLRPLHAGHEALQKLEEHSRGGVIHSLPLLFCIHVTLGLLVSP